MIHLSEKLHTIFTEEIEMNVKEKRDPEIINFPFM